MEPIHQSCRMSACSDKQQKVCAHLDCLMHGRIIERCTYCDSSNLLVDLKLEFDQTVSQQLQGLLNSGCSHVTHKLNNCYFVESKNQDINFDHRQSDYCFAVAHQDLHNLWLFDCLAPISFKYCIFSEVFFQNHILLVWKLTNFSLNQLECCRKILFEDVLFRIFSTSVHSSFLSLQDWLMLAVQNLPQCRFLSSYHFSAFLIHVVLQKIVNQKVIHAEKQIKVTIQYWIDFEVKLLESKETVSLQNYCSHLDTQYRHIYVLNQLQGVKEDSAMNPICLGCLFENLPSKDSCSSSYCQYYFDGMSLSAYYFESGLSAAYYCYQTLNSQISFIIIYDIHD